MEMALQQSMTLPPPMPRITSTFFSLASLAIQQGVDVKTVSSILGHYSAGFTLDTYAHVTGEMHKEAADRMGSFIAQAI